MTAPDERERRAVDLFNARRADFERRCNDDVRNAVWVLLLLGGVSGGIVGFLIGLMF